MFGLPEKYNGFYYLILVLQGLCVLHTMRKGNQNKWIWIIVCLPMVGSLIYIFTEIINKRDVSSMQSGIINVINPGGRLKTLEKNFNFSDTLTNRIALADSYLERNQNEKAIALYEPVLDGLYHDNEHVIKHLAEAYYNVGRIEDVIRIIPKATRSLTFSSSRANLIYAFALEKTGQNNLAEKEYKGMNHRFSNYEARYYYIRYLINASRLDDAKSLVQTILNEDSHMNRREKGDSKIWIDKVKEQAKQWL